MKDDEEYSEGGSRIYRHEAAAEEQPEFSGGDEALIAAVSEHVGTHIGSVVQVFHEIISPTVHVDVHWVSPTAERPWHTLVTSGMAERPMTVPEGMEEWAYAELTLNLPAHWPMDAASWEDEASYWPIRWLKLLARLPHEYQTWLGEGHSVPNGDPAAPLAANTRLSGVVLLPPREEEFATLYLSPERTIHLWSVVPVYPEEMKLKLRKGSEALLEAFRRAGVSDVIDPVRPSAARSRWWPFG